MECDLGELVDGGALYTVSEILGRDEVWTVCEVLEYLSPTRRAVLHRMNPALTGSVRHRSSGIGASWSARPSSKEFGTRTFFESSAPEKRAPPCRST